MKLKLVGAALAIQLLLLSPATQAADSVSVEADQMEIFDAQHKTVFRGNVVAVRPNDQITSDEMVVTNEDQKQPDGTLKSVTSLLDAKGHVRIKTKTQTITGAAARFFVQKNTLEVTGNVVVVQGQNSIKGEKLLVDLKTNHLQMLGGRVQGSFVPK